MEWLRTEVVMHQLEAASLRFGALPQPATTFCFSLGTLHGMMSAGER